MKKYLLLILFAIVSCKNASDNIEYGQTPTEFKQPVSQLLKLSEPKKIDWAGIKAVSIQPFVDKFDTNKFPALRYDTAGFKPVSRSAERAKFDYNSLPEKDFDIDKLPSQKLHFKTYVLQPPKLIKAGPPRIKNVHAGVYELAQIPELKGAHISCLFTDKDGFLWIATLTGLYRYDGENLLLYMNITSNYVIAMVQDSQDRIWMNEQDHGIDIMDLKNGTLEKTEHGNGLGGKDIVWIVKDKNQRLWVTFRAGGINIIDPETETAKWLDKANGMPALRATSILQANDDNIWITTIGGAMVINLKNKKVKYLDKTNYLKTDSLLTVTQDNDKRIWLGSYSGMVCIIDTEKGSIQYFKEKKSWAFYEFNEMVWKELEDGVEIVNTKNNSALQIHTTNGLDDPSVEEVTPDKQGQVWIGTDNGLNMASNVKTLVEHIKTPSVSSLTADKDGLMWLGTGRGIDIINRKTKTSRHFTIHHGPDNDSVSTINEINGSIFICSRKGLDIIDRSRTSITHFGKEQGVNNYKTQAVLVDDENRLWIGGRENGIDVYNPADKTIKHIGKSRGLSDNNISDIKKDTQGRIWVSTVAGGIDVIDTKTWLVKNINFDYGLRSMAGDNKGNMWIAAEDTKTGIFIADLNNNLLINFSSAQGLIGSSVNSILINNGRVYAGTDKGITVITPPAAGINTNGKWGVESFGKSYGLNRLEPFSFLTDALTKDGLYCWGDDGISVLDLSKKDTFATATFITGIGVTHNNDTLWDQDNDTHYIKDKIPLSMADKRQRGISWDNISGPYNMPVNLQLPYDQNLMRFNYGNLNLTDHDTTWYRYRLEGAGKNWSPQTTETASGNYFNLTPGKYIFEVSSKTADNGWSTPARLSFTIIPPWWIRWWAWGLYIILLSGVIYAFVYLRSRQLVKEKNKLEREIQIRTEEVLQQKEEIEAQRDKLEMEKIRADIAADFHDELGSTLSSIALYSEMAITDSSADERTKNILSLIGESSRGTVSAMQDMIWTIQPKNDKMQEVIYRMREYAYPLAELKNISLTFDAGENVQDLILSMDIRKNIYLIFKEALNNAFKYASATCITITMFKRDNLLHLEIIDDGAGFDLENAKAGNGLANMHKRAAQAAGTLHIKSFKGRGTEILFSCPVG